MPGSAPAALCHPPGPIERLRGALDRLYTDFDRVESAADPVHIVRGYAAPEDREVIGFCAAALAFGRVTSVLQSIHALRAEMGSRPAEYVRRFAPDRDGGALRPLGHRWTRGVDLVALVWTLRRMLDAAGSIEGFFLDGFEPGSADVGPGLERFATRVRAMDLRPAYGRVPRVPGVWYFFPRPSTGSACKRLNLFLRWMVRRDAIDLGVWSRVPASALIVPLDTHVIRLGQCLGLTRYRRAGWRMATEITGALRQLDPADPVKYDFSLCHLGMTNACGFSRPQADAQCPLRGICRPRPRRRPASPAPSARR
jgi:uncharacterized protein (TIGR02757 family)